MNCSPQPNPNALESNAVLKPLLRHNELKGAAMSTFIMLTRLAHGALHAPQALEQLEQEVKARVREQFGEGTIEWLASYAVLGPYDYVDIFRAPDIDAAMKVATIIRTFGHAHTEVWAATEWSQFKDMIRALPSASGASQPG